MAPGVGRVDPGAEELCGTVPDPNDIPTLVVYQQRRRPHRRRPRRDRGRRPPRSPPIEGVTEPASSARRGAATRGPTSRRSSPRTARSPSSTSPSTSARTAGTRSPTPPTRSARSPTIDGVDVHLAGFGGQAADAAEVFAGVDGALLLATLGVVILILLFTYRSPVLWMLPIFCADGRLHRRRAASSTCWPSTPTSPSTARARRSSPSW